jgi:hypothetical protein
MLTNVGRNKEAAALANGTALAISALAWGAGDRIPGGGETTLEDELGRKPVTRRGLTDGSPDTAFFEVLLAESEGPYVIREAGLFDDDGDMIAIARYDPAVNKPLDTVSAILRINVLFSDLENLVIQIDNATSYVPGERELIVGDGLTGGGDLSEDRTLAVTFATEAEALAGASSVKVMSPVLVEAVVTQAITDLVNGAPGALDTLNELATALSDSDGDIDAILVALAGKQDLNTNLTAFLAALTLPTADGAGGDLMVFDGAGGLVPGKGYDEYVYDFDVDGGASTIDFTDLGDYRIIEYDMSVVWASSGSAGLRVSNGNGLTFHSSNYAGGVIDGTDSSSLTGKFGIIRTNANAAFGSGRLHNFNDPLSPTISSGVFGGGGSRVSAHGGRRSVNELNDAIRFIFNDATTSGKIVVRGYR